MLARLFYGMARNGQLPAMFARVSPRTGTPLWATALAGCIVTGAAVVVSFEQLLVLTNALTLAILYSWTLRCGAFRGRQNPQCRDLPHRAGSHRLPLSLPRA